MEDLAEQLVAFPGPLPIDLVVGGHDAGHTLGDDPPEVGQEDLVEGNLGDLDIHLESGVLDGVGGEVLDRRHGVALDAPG